MPLFSAKSEIQVRANDNRNPLNCDCLTNCRFNYAGFSTQSFTARSSRSQGRNQVKLLTEERQWLWLRSRERMLDLDAHIDGGCFGNPGPAGIGVVIHGAATGPIRIAKWIGRQDSNVAEYAALIEVLQCALSLHADRLHVYSDSEVVVKQMTGEYGCRSPRLYSLHWTCRKLARSLHFSISHIGRENNIEANTLANFAVRNGPPKRALTS
jgi:ribonuclease HI